MNQGCVYTVPAALCKGTAPLSKREHYLPRALGNFRDDPRLRLRICNDCQRKFRDAEDVFAHASPEAFFREMIGMVGRKRGRKKNIFYEPTFGIAPLTVIGTLPGEDVPILWEVLDAEHAQPMKQIIVQDRNGRRAHVPYRSGKTTKELVITLMRRANLAEPKAIVQLATTDEEIREMEAACEGVLPPGGTVRETPLLGNGMRVEGEMRAPISRRYQQAIAKIAFHFFLQYFPRYSGFEPEFEPIKAFIYSGTGNADRFVRATNEPFVLELQRGGRAKQWLHLLSAETDGQRVVSRMQFFVGPRAIPLVWHVELGRDPARVVYPDSKACSYIYYDRPLNGYDGHRSEMPAAVNIQLIP